MVTRNLTRWGIGLALLVIVGYVVLWVLDFLVGFTVLLVKLGLLVAVGIGLLYVIRELYDGWSRAG